MNDDEHTEASKLAAKLYAAAFLAKEQLEEHLLKTWPGKPPPTRIEPDGGFAYDVWLRISLTHGCTDDVFQLYKVGRDAFKREWERIVASYSTVE
jgi:hypothetical protein